jgi:hypothetical protein
MNLYPELRYGADATEDEVQDAASSFVSDFFLRHQPKTLEFKNYTSMEIAYNVAVHENTKYIVHVNTGTLPKLKAEEYMREILRKFNGGFPEGSLMIVPIRYNGLAQHNTRWKFEVIPGAPTTEQVLVVRKRLDSAEKMR